MSEWGPWIEHDGGPRPVARGTFCHLVYNDGAEIFGPVGCAAIGIPVTPDGKPWGWPSLIIRYRIRKPLGLTILENLIADLPAPVGPKVDA